VLWKDRDANDVKPESAFHRNFVDKIIGNYLLKTRSRARVCLWGDSDTCANQNKSGLGLES
jgi:hypothetical protein